jgi:cardiolipin synthase C
MHPWSCTSRASDAARRCAAAVRAVPPLLALSALLAGCVGLPPPSGQAPSTAVVASARTDLGARAAQALARADTPPGQSGFLPMPQADVALHARLTLIRRAQVSLDLQYYLLGNDEVGHLVLRELRDAAARGVRVRLLLDDFYTGGMDRLLLGLAVHPNVEVRLFNPFGAGRVSTLGRLASLAGDFRRLNHRMHNKLFVADGALAVVGGRNLADGYFMRDPGANFIDFDALAVGPVVTQLSGIFDLYWNSGQVHAVQSVARTADTPDTLRAAFDAEVTAYTRRFLPPPPPSDEFGVPLLALELEAGLPHLVWADAAAYADAPDKLLAHARGDDAATQGAAFRNLETLSAARREVILFSPYFVPGEKGMKRMQAARAKGIAIRVLTNAMSATDEPLATLAYERYRVSMLRMGVELYELSSTQVRQDPTMRAFLGDSRAQLHVKLGMVDRETLILGSTNLDQRSITTNTELAVKIASPRLCQEILAFYNSADPSKARGAYQVLLAPDGQSLQWLALRGEDGPELLQEEPEVDHLLRVKLWLMSLFVSEDLL